MSSKEKIKEITDKVCTMLQEKNESYGDSALEPINVFSKGSATESLCARIDDKLSRIRNKGINDETEDTLFDLIGYLTLLMIANEMEIKNTNDIYKRWTKTTT